MEWSKHSEECNTCRRMAIRGRRRKPSFVAAEHRQKREAETQHAKAVSSACDLLLSQPIPPTRKLQKVAANVIRSLISDDNSPVQLSTGGPKLTLQKVATPRKASDKASSRTVRERSRQLKSILAYCSSPNHNPTAADYQLAALLLNAKSAAELQRFLTDHNLLKIRIPNGQELAMKAQLGWSWSMMRKMKIWLRAYNIFMAAESVTRRYRSEIIGDVLNAEMVPFFFKDEDGTKFTKLAAMVTIRNVVDHIMETLDALDREGHLTWDKIPADQIWVKLGGDAGGGTTKFYYQICNIPKNNSRHNTTVFCVYEADESVANMHIALDRFVDQINSLQSLKWRGLTIVPWLSGDYLVECKLLGLQGASAMFPCSRCHAKKGALQEKDEETEERTVETIISDYDQVETENFTADAKRRNHSVANKPFFNIPISNVCPPGLHISLGLWNKFYQLLLNDIQKLGEVIVDELAEQPHQDQQTTTKFNNHVAEVRDIRSTIKQKTDLAADKRAEAVDEEYDMINQSLLSPIEPNQQQMDHIADLHQQANQLDKEAKALRDTYKLKEDLNPLVSQMDESLKSFKVRRQAYHSKTFVGNHVDKCLKVENYTRLLEDIVLAAKDLTPGPRQDDIHDAAVAIKMKYLLLFQKFAVCHKKYNRADKMTPGDISELEEYIEDLVSYYLTRFPEATFTPKFHILLDHVVPFIRKTEVGLGMMAEQGAEQLHNIYNVIGRRLEGVRNVKGVTPELHHLKCVVAEHLVMVHPTTRRVVNNLGRLEE